MQEDEEKVALKKPRLEKVEGCALHVPPRKFEVLPLPCWATLSLRHKPAQRVELFDAFILKKGPLLLSKSSIFLYWLIVLLDEYLPLLPQKGAWILKL